MLAAYVEDALADMEQPALPTDIGMGPIVFIGTPIVYPASSLRASSSSLPLPPSSPPLVFSASVVSSAKRTAQMVDEVESGGEVLGNAESSLVGQMVVFTSLCLFALTQTSRQLPGQGFPHFTPTVPDMPLISCIFIGV